MANHPVDQFIPLPISTDDYTTNMTDADALALATKVMTESDNFFPLGLITAVMMLAIFGIIFCYCAVGIRWIKRKIQAAWRARRARGKCEKVHASAV
ncbi:hypothetical protein FPQ18DRAFT_401043 [Pyronema domesticum]|uniref:Uncharacterized protein n=1 Tax=Pyronema omphalodes (strain CBS 100304) TaxID=1076935 RepID=U4LAU3_PYROM|nr:hypothetical protein FPQ18DRAFT_401043 [Pyronema domesticum]CCX10958.1 Protein of unknown function [Pyronema omphalodes CBS 100304]